MHATLSLGKTKRPQGAGINYKELTGKTSMFILRRRLDKKPQ